MIQIEDLQFSYPRQSRLFNNLSLQLEPGSITGLLGKNGSGKTTLLKLLSGLLHPHSGTLSVLGNIPDKRAVSMLSEVFFVPEEFYFPSVTFKVYCCSYSPFYPRFDEGLLDRILHEFNLDAKTNLQNLSQGQKKKFLIAFALASRCRLLVLDEPTNGLDIPSKALFRKILAGSLDEKQLVIISTHQVKDVENLIDKIIILDNGRIIFHQTIEEISKTVSFTDDPTTYLEDTIYSETAPGGQKRMIPAGEYETEVDIELLFNAITNGKQIG
jgi:ABC-2 type transport system ATP-binding protein